ncbi:MAG: NCS2 family permease [Candidatus Eiseniibacteriota bacterium]
MLERLFRLRDHQTTVGREVIGGVVTFMALSYILFVQPVILSSGAMTEPMDHGGVFVATCVASALACLLMGLWARLPVALAPAMGHNVFFAFTVCGAAAMGWGWRQALAANLVAGSLFVLLAAGGLQQALARSIPDSLKYAIAVGIGLLITFVGLQYGGLVVDDPAVYVRLGDLGSPVALLTLTGLALTGVMMARGVRGALLYGVLATTLIGLVASELRGDVWDYRLVTWQGVVGPVPGAGETVGGALRGLGGLFGGHGVLDWLIIVFVFLILDIFDTVGTLVGVTERAGLARDGVIPGLRQALLADGVATVAGAAMGTTTITSYVESAAGIAAGARTGLATVVTGALLLASLFFYPLVSMVGGTVLVSAAELGAIVPAGGDAAPAVACHPVIAPVLILVGCYMMPVIRRIRWDDIGEALPAFLTIVVMQFGLSISHGIAWGFIAHVVLMVGRGRAREVHPLVAVFAVLLALFLASG